MRPAIPSKVFCYFLCGGGGLRGWLCACSVVWVVLGSAQLGRNQKHSGPTGKIVRQMVAVLRKVPRANFLARSYIMSGNERI